ncbi:MAG TPA: hypothetical protein VGI42_06565 [Chthoniobacterales bacterium]
MHYSSITAGALLLTAILSAGCASDKPNATGSSAGKFFAVASDSTPFFRHSPQQGSGPDRTLPRDTRLKMIRPSFGYSKVELADSHEQGYVASDDIKPAGSLVAVATMPPQPSASLPASQSAAEHFKIDSADPRLVPPADQLPDSEPSQAPLPGQ